MDLDKLDPAESGRLHGDRDRDGVGVEDEAEAGAGNTDAVSIVNGPPASSPSVIQKSNDIIDACKWRDIARLKSLAESAQGFLTDDLRRLAWPILLGLPLQALEKGDGVAQPNPKNGSNPSDNDWMDLPRHRDEDQVQLDVNRSFIYYPNEKSDAEISKRKQELSRLIGEVLRRNPYLCYFQGYHDICQVFLLVLQPESRAQMVARLSVLRIRDFMLPSLGPTTMQLKLLPDVLALADPELRRHIASIEPYYALAGTLTMYSHNIEGYHDIARTFDVILAHEPVFTIYIFAQIVMDRREEILDIDEHDMLQVILGRVPSKMDLDSLVMKAVALSERYPPETLPSWSRISNASVLKTARDVNGCAKQTLDDGHRYFEIQTSEIHWDEMRTRIKMTLWAYRRPAGMIGIALVVGLVAIQLRRNLTTLQYMQNILPRWRALWSQYKYYIGR